jgi:4-hydroxybenzoate polyprenyltransferase
MSAAPETAPVAPAGAASSSSSMPLLLIRALRPRQWTKNLPALAPLLFAKGLFRPEMLLRGVAAVATFCLLAGGVYIFNDWFDREKDRLHPEKRKRPIASGQLGPVPAFTLLAVVWAGGLALAAWVGTQFSPPSFGFLGVAAGYLVLQVLYSLWLKHVVILDVGIIATGFILRVAGGGVAVGVELSHWLYLCTLLLAIFLGFAKRRAELASLQGDASAHRASLSEYTVPLLDQMITVVAASCIVAYGLYTVSPDTVAKVHSDGLKFTVPFVIYAMFRYMYLIHRRNAGGSPERVLLSDLPLIIDILLYLGVSGWVLYAPH